MMDDRAIVKILKEEEADAASYYDSEIAQAQATAMDRYNAKPLGNEVDDPARSKVVTHDIEDTINWVMPHLMRVFLESDELITCEDDALDDDEALKTASDYLSHVFFRDNPGDTIIHDFAFDALLQKIAVARAYWEDPKPKPEQEIEGLTADQLVKYVSDPEYEIIEAEQEQKQDENGQPYVCYELKVRRTPKIGRCRIEGVPPEQFYVSRRARSIKDADYHGWRSPAFLADIVREFPEKRSELDPSGKMLSSADDGDAGNLASDTRAESRFPDEPTTTRENDSASNEFGRKKVQQNVEYLRCDYDGDGVVELRRIRRVGNVILENDSVEESEFVTWSPIRVAHRLIGRSLADTLMDLQEIRTVLTRAALDGMSRSLLPRTIINKRMASTSTYDQLLDHDIGAVIEVDGPVGDAIREIVSPDVSQSALGAIEYFDRRSEEASGVNRHAQGIAPDAITKTKGGIDMLQSAANSRIELLARWMGLGLQELLEKVMRILITHQDGARVVKIAGKRMQIDPRRWSDEMTVSVHVGMAAESRDKKLMSLNLIAQKQEAILMQGGPGNPLVGMPEYRQTLVQMAQSMGFKNGSRFFKEIPEGWQPPPPGEDPKMAEVKQKGQLAQADMQQKGQLQAAELQGKQQLAQMEAQITAQQAAQKAETEKQIAGLKLQSEQMINAARLDMEKELALVRMEQERQLAMLKMAQEREIAMESMKQKAKAGENGTGTGYREGGRLDA